MEESKMGCIRDSKVIIIKKGAMLWCIDYETICMTIWNCNVSLRTNGGTPSQIAHPRENMGRVLTHGRK